MSEPRDPDDNLASQHREPPLANPATPDVNPDAPAVPDPEAPSVPLGASPPGVDDLVEADAERREGDDRRQTPGET